MTRGAESVGHLDLTAPTAQTQAPDKTSMRFPSSIHHQVIAGMDDGGRLPTLAIEANQGREIGRAEEFARRVHREGVPLARLWENKSALVSLGLNQKGKAGLWLIQKVH